MKTGNKIDRARATSLSIVDTVSVWRNIQRNFQELLNGAVDRLKNSLDSKEVSSLKESLAALKDGYRGKRLAVETELERSKI